jgi:hypothetical protein
MHVGHKVDECEHNDTCKIQIYMDYTIIYKRIFFIFHGLPIFGNFARECSFCVPSMWISMNVHIQSE